MGKVYGAFCWALTALLCARGVIAAPSAYALEESRGETIVQTSLVREDSYYSYDRVHADKPAGAKTVETGAQMLTGSEKAEIVTSEHYDKGRCVLVREGGYAEFTVEVAEAGRYAVRLDYINFGNDGVRLEVALSIDGRAPFYDAGHLSLFSAFEDRFPVGDKTDSRGNDIAPDQREVTICQSVYLEDTTGVYSEPYRFYFEKGTHTVRIKSLRRDIGICAIRLCPAPSYMPYAEALEKYRDSGLSPVEDFYDRLEAEKPLLKSDSSIVPRDDHASSLTVPYTPFAIKLNMIGGGSWSGSGQWITWEVEAPKEGLYRIALRARQNQISGLFVSRELYVNGEIPFEEARTVEVRYDMGWQLVEFPYYIPLHKGKNTITLKATPGRLSELAAKAENALYQLNLAYRRIVMVTGSDPDIYRDYALTETVPEAFEIFDSQQGVLKEIDKSLFEMTGSRGSMNGILQTLAQQLGDFVKRPDTVQLRLDALKSNITAFGSWVVTCKQQNLELDSIFIYSDKSLLPKIESGFFGYLLHELKAFIASFFVDYSLIGDTYDSGESIDVWVQTGRDQANIIRELVTGSFIPESGINVNVKLVQGQLLPATVAGRGPDAVLQVASGDPVNYALRGMVEPLSDMNGYSETVKNFRKSALVPYTLGKKVYALPETQTFQVMFYRSDILQELGLSAPRTWPEFFKAVGILQKNNMTAGVEAPSSVLGSSNGMASMGMFLHQLGGSFYAEDGSRSLLSSDSAVEAFKTWVSLYTDYNLPVKYDALTRFRIGEIPILIADYTFMNLVSVAAPEIRGLWEFSSVPGTVQADGSIRRDVTGTGLGCMIIKTGGETTTENAWRFLRWWTSKETQYRFGMSIENRLGVSARYPTANTEAFKNLPWSSQEYAVLQTQWENVHGIPEVAGSYYTSRNINNAFRRVLSYGEDPKEALLDYTKKIDEEISAKRRELGLE